MLAATITGPLGDTNIFDVANSLINAASGNSPTPASPTLPSPTTTTTTAKPGTWPTVKPWYKDWKVWAAVTGGVAVVGGGMYVLSKR